MSYYEIFGASFLFMFVLRFDCLSLILNNFNEHFNCKRLIDMLDKAIRVQKQKYIDSNLSGADNDTAEGRAFQLQLKMAQERCRFLADGEFVLCFMDVL